MYTSLSIAGNGESKRMRHHLGILNSIDSDIDLLSNNKTNRDKDFLNVTLNLNIKESLNLYYTQNLAIMGSSKTWMDVYEKIDVTGLKHYTKLIIIAGAKSVSNGIFRGSKRLETFPFDGGQLKFISVASRIFNILVMLKAHNEYKIPLHEYQYDTLEASCNLFKYIYPKYDYTTYYGYEISQYNSNRLDSHQYYLLNYETKPKLEKTINFIGGYTSGYKGKPKLYDRDTIYKKELYKFSNNFTDSEIYISNSGNPEGSAFLDWDEYNTRISKSRYTMIFPAYDTNVISIDRLIGAIWCDCLPIFHSSCGFDEVEKSFDVDLKQLITNKPFKEDTRLELLEELNKKIIVFKHGFI